MRAVLSKPMRVISLLPSATEQFATIIEAAKELHNDKNPTEPLILPELVGRSHECDYPKYYASVPILTQPKTKFTTCKDVHNQVLQVLQSDSSLYDIDTDLLTQLEPDLIVVQDICKVCSIDKPSVACAFDDTQVQILLVNSRNLTHALEDSVLTLGKALHLEDAAHYVVAKNKKRLNELTKQANDLAQVKNSTSKKPVIFMVEWMDPLFLAKGWAMEMIELAGGQAPDPSGKITNPDVVGDSDVIVVAFCGLDRETTKKELSGKILPTWWTTSTALKNDNLFLVDGNQMFNRPTNRLLDALEWLIHLVNDASSIEQNSVVKHFPFERWTNADMDEYNRLNSVQRDLDAEWLEIEEIHNAACLKHDVRYKDPKTGYGVFTAWYLSERQTCCGNRCRHCPYGHVNVSAKESRKNVIRTSVFIKAPKPRVVGRLDYKNTLPVKSKTLPPKPRDAIVVFWSGGKDSLLSLWETIQKKNKMQMNDDSREIDIVLLTTFNPEESIVSIQNIDTVVIIAQATALNLPISVVAVPSSANYAELVQEALIDIPKKMGVERVTTLVFGDLHLSDIRAWREGAFASWGYDLQFPLWERHQKNDLLPLLAQLCAEFNLQISYSAVDNDKIPESVAKKGSLYDFDTLPSHIDSMGENGEFHTVVEFL